MKRTAHAHVLPYIRMTTRYEASTSGTAHQQPVSFSPEASMARLRHCVLSHTDYTRLNREWSDTDAESYLKIFRNTAAIETMRSESILGILIRYHEKKELSVLSTLLDGYHGTPGFTAAALAHNSLTRTDIFTHVQGVRAQTQAHRVALDAELVFCTHIARELGYLVTRNALIVTHPRLLRACARFSTNLDDVLSSIVEMESELGPINPEKAEIQWSRHFWESHGIIYSGREKRLLDGETLPPLEKDD